MNEKEFYARSGENGSGACIRQGLPEHLLGVGALAEILTLAGGM